MASERRRSSSKFTRQALIISAKQFNRSILAHQLRQLGIANLKYASRYFEAKRILENGSYDLVLLDDDLGMRGENGQSLIDDLRRCGLMDMQTIVVLTASSATYSQVTEAAESGIDSYLLRPYSLSSLQQRLETSMLRRVEMSDIYAALQRKDWDDALERCLFKFANRESFWLYAARIAAEIYIHKGKPQQAQHLYEEIVRHEALPWAKLGVGRALLEQGKHQSAIEQLQSVVDQHAEQTDAYDLMGRAHLEAGDHERALEVYRLAVAATPSSVSRVQRLGFAAFYAGDHSTAREMLERSIRIGLNSKSFDLQALFTLALLYIQEGRADELGDLDRRLASLSESPAHSGKRLNLVTMSVRCISDWAAGADRSARLGLDDILYCSEDVDFDFDSACNTVQLLSMAAQRGQQHQRDLGVIDKIGLRFAHSKLASAWLARSALDHPPYAEALQDAHTRAFKQAQEIVQRTMSGHVQAAVTDLVALAENALNARIIEMAERLLERHAPKIPTHEELAARIARIKVLNDPVQLRRNPTNRQLRHPGGITLLSRLNN